MRRTLQAGWLRTIIEQSSPHDTVELSSRLLGRPIVGEQGLMAQDWCRWGLTPVRYGGQTPAGGRWFRLSHASASSKSRNTSIRTFVRPRAAYVQAFWYSSGSVTRNAVGPRRRSGSVGI